jgi:hypothetical protein
VKPSSYIEIEVKHVLRSQGIDPNHPNAKNPQLVELAQRAIETGRSLIDPTAVYRRLNILKLQHERIYLHEAHILDSPLLVQHMAGANAVFVVLCTIGHNLEAAIKDAQKSNPAFALALDGFGSAAVEAFSNALCVQFEHEAAERARQTSIPLSPGMIGWPVDRGQTQIFSILDAQSIGVSINAARVMTPRKSLSFVIAEGVNLQTGRKTCEYCAMHETCRYQDHYHPE